MCSGAENAPVQVKREVGLAGLPWRVDQMIPDALVESYFGGIGYAGAAPPTLQTLIALHAFHAAAIPFENLDVLRNRPISLEPRAIANKIVSNGRGGYCYEHNTLFLAVLRTLGMRTISIGARVLWNTPESAVSRTHMLLVVRLPEGRFIADVGFGRLTLAKPLRLEPDIEHWTKHGIYRLVRSHDEFQLQSMLGDKWRALYEFSLQEQLPADWDVANWYTSTHPASIFRRSLIVARLVDGMRYTLLDNRFSVDRSNGTMDRRMIETPEELGLVLRRDFDLKLPPACERVLTSVAGKRG
jgi:N-hydroxyarylamine O-acetyltransferase